jgi:signal transduction histidine kinase
LQQHRQLSAIEQHLADGRWLLISERRTSNGGIAGLRIDITALKAAQEKERQLTQQLLHSQKLQALGTLAGGVAHDLNNTLVPIVALSKLTLEEVSEDSAIRGDLETIIEASEQARDLVSQILAFSRKQELARCEIDLEAVVRHGLRMLRAGLPATISLIEEISPVPPLLGDACQLRNVLVNLVTNAAQAITTATGTISVRLAAHNSVISLSVADTGVGMSPHIIERIFEPFYTTKDVGEGTGLGLSVVHGIVTGHDGRIEVSSTLGEGTMFTVLLPAVADRGAEMEPLAA